MPAEIYIQRQLEYDLLLLVKVKNSQACPRDTFFYPIPLQLVTVPSHGFPGNSYEVRDTMCVSNV